MGGRGRRHSCHQRRLVLTLIAEAVGAGARLSQACKLLGLTSRTIQRWRKQPENQDCRNGPGRKPSNALTEDEHQQMMEVLSTPELSHLSPAQLVAHLADQGVYIASESSFYRLMREHNLLKTKGKTKRGGKASKPSAVAHAPNQVWVWDITCLPIRTKGKFVYLYMVLDLFSRKIVGWEIHPTQNANMAQNLMKRSILEHGAQGKGMILHSDNGSVMRSYTLEATLRKLEVFRSFSRPRVSNDNAFAESCFGTLKSRPNYPKRQNRLEDWQNWAAKFVDWYNNQHRHSGIGMVTPAQRHKGEDEEILMRRRQLYQQAKQKHPNRWSGSTRSWERPGAVHLAPEQLAA